MNKRIIFIIAGTVLAAACLLVAIYKRGPAAANNRSAVRIDNKQASKLYDEAAKLAGEGKVSEASDIYKRILAECPGSNLVSSARSKIDVLNIKILFSPIPTKDSTIYEVVAGDNLVKIARKFGTTVDLITKANALSSTVIRPGMKLKISKAKYSILVDKSQNILILSSDGEVSKTY